MVTDIERQRGGHPTLVTVPSGRALSTSLPLLSHLNRTASITCRSVAGLFKFVFAFPPFISLNTDGSEILRKHSPLLYFNITMIKSCVIRGNTDRSSRISLIFMAWSAHEPFIFSYFPRCQKVISRNRASILLMRQWKS